MATVSPNPSKCTRLGSRIHTRRYCQHCNSFVSKSTWYNHLHEGKFASTLNCNATSSGQTSSQHQTVSQFNLYGITLQLCVVDCDSVVITVLYCDRMKQMNFNLQTQTQSRPPMKQQMI